MKNRLEKLRKQRGITQDALADALSVSRQTVGPPKTRELYRWHLEQRVRQRVADGGTASHQVTLIAQKEMTAWSSPFAPK